MTIDLNCDLGEGAENDELLMPLVTSASIACGGHAGDETTMRTAVRLARYHGVAIGAHPGFEDRAHFGRKEQFLAPCEIVKLVRSQVEALQKIARDEGTAITYVKPHGALYTMAASNPMVADAIAEAVCAVDAKLWLYGLAGSAGLKVAAARGLRLVAEVFADRSYQADGTLTPRGRADALLANAEEGIARVLGIIRNGRIRTVDGVELALNADTVCLHGDSPQSVEFARGICTALVREGVLMRALSHG